MAIICFAGCDKVGKSTLLRGVLKRTNRHICIDRFAACQFIYGNYYNKKDTPTIEYLRTVEGTLKTVGGIYVHVTASTEDIKERFVKHNENSIKIEDIELIKQGYIDYLCYSRMPVLNINTSDNDIETCVDRIIRFGDYNDRRGIKCLHQWD